MQKEPGFAAMRLSTNCYAVQLPPLGLLVTVGDGPLLSVLDKPVVTTQTRFLRRAEVTVSRGGSQVLKADESLRIVFNIRRDAAPETQPSIIALYNLAFETRQLIQEQDRVRLSAGYANTELALVAEGDIRRIDHETLGLRPDFRNRHWPVGYQVGQPV